MSSRPRVTIDDSLVEALPCAICGAEPLNLVHVKDYPDYVVCPKCKSAFVVEDEGDRVMYGSIPAEYPQTRKIALRQWAAFDDIEAAAQDERPPAPPVRPASVPIPTLPEPPSPPEQSVLLTAEEPPAAQPSPSLPEKPPEPAGAEEKRAAVRPPGTSPLDRLAALTAGMATSEPEPTRAASAPPVRPSQTGPSLLGRMGEARPAGEKAILPEVPGISAPAARPSAPASPAAKPALLSGPGEPPKGERYRVLTNSPKVTIPQRVCAHCLRSPAPRRLSIAGWVPQTLAIQRRMNFRIPLCSDCGRRAGARSDEEKNARLQAYLVSALVALVLLVAGLAFKLIDLQQQPVVGLFLVIVVLSFGYALPATVLLNRAGRHPPLPDAAYVRTTLVIPRQPEGTQVAFEWRNRNYAEIFLQANASQAASDVTKVKDRTENPPMAESGTAAG